MACQLTLAERERISQMQFVQVHPTEIAKALGRSRSTISRELRRNSLNDSYSAIQAQEQAARRRRERPLERKMERPELSAYVRSGLVQYWSPDQIAGRTRRDFPREAKRRISRQTIYNWFHGLVGEEHARFAAFLRRRGKRRPRDDRRGQLPRTVSIDGRPKVVDRRRRYGDWEGDTVVGARRSGAIVTLVERKCGYTLAAKSCDRQAWRIGDKIRRLLRDLPATLRRTLTLDNGKEFADHETFSDRLHLRTFFAKPYSAWQRGTNENTNGLLRQFVPKGTDFSTVSWQAIERYVTLLNQRPRKRLGYRTPDEVFTDHVAFET